ncbi:MAG: bifunctional 2-polyprenyl-6-hydroxyphenol methylase/3-demethylubiquinol 3-O-methyltransferase UbiG [Rhodoblastus sp.]
MAKAARTETARQDSHKAKPRSASVDAADVARFDALGEDWWDLWGPMRALHKLNPTRVDYVRNIFAEEMRDAGRACEARPAFAACPSGASQDEGLLSGLRVLDIGCGGGILSEPLARLGARMTSIDPAPSNIVVARAHAEKSGLDIDYRETTAEELAATGQTFDIVLIMEVVEHVADRPAFIATAASLVRPGGFLFAATLNRTLKSYALAIVGAEYVLRWVKPGTHNWSQFVTPQELAADFRAAGLEIYDRTGVVYNPVFDEWRTSEDCAVNYMMAAQKPAE